jgi:hypothetical protein
LGEGWWNREDYEGGIISRMKADKYIMSFTAGGLLQQGSVTIAELYLENQNWNVVREIVLESNLLQTRTQNASMRLFREIGSRLKTLNDNEIGLLVNGTSQEQAQVLWIAVCRRFKFIRDFAVEVIREKYINFQYELSHGDFDSFFNEKVEWYRELDKIKPATRAKLRQILFRMLREAGLLTTDNAIMPMILSPRVKSLLNNGKQEGFYIFPLHDPNS